MRNLIIWVVFLVFIGNYHASAQRRMEKLDRGVVAVRNSGGKFFVSWRYLATDPDNIQFNLYAGASKLNASPLSLTNLTLSSGAVSEGTQLYVTPIINGVEGAPSGSFTIPGNGFTTYRSAYFDIAFNPAADGLDLAKYATKFCWPVDLDGDGEYDYVVDRLSTKGKTHKIQGYLRNGTLLWTVDIGPNFSIDQGSSDMVTAYDMDGDGKAEVLIKSSDGTKFANGKGVLGSTTLDTDNDGIIDYTTQSVKNPPFYITAINGMTGVEKNSIEMKYPSNYTRTNKAAFMGDEYNTLTGHMIILYIDGKHPSLGFVYHTRTTDGTHWYYASTYGYDKAGNWVNWYNWERGNLDAAEGHGIRAADVDLDGRDELLDIGYGIKYDGSLAFNAHIGHGDRYRVADIDPERPGLETFAIQQSNLLGQLLYDAATGEHIKEYYLSSLGDVGRGECMDVDSTHLGYEFWSTMPNMYDAKGNAFYEGTAPYPFEGVWWDGGLARDELSAADGSGYNADIRKYDITSHSFASRSIEFAKMTNWKVVSENGVRPMFFGDIAGDWREEIILKKLGSAIDTLKDISGNDSIATVTANIGFVGFSTDYPTSQRIYCLMQNPAYRMQCTAKGYYQSSFPDFYLGYNMPTPPLAPVQKAKLTWKSGTTFDNTSSNFVLDDEKTSSKFSSGDDIMFDISGDNTSDIQLNTDLAPSKIWAINPRGHDYTLSGTGKLTGTMELVKSLNGTFTLNGNHTYTGTTTISEGSLFVNGTLTSPVVIQAKGTLGGNAIINGGITLNPGLNVEGGRLAPGNGLVAGKLGKMIINSDVNVGGKVNVQFDILPFDTHINDSLIINGNLIASGVNNIVINTESGVLPSGTYSLIHWTGTLTGSLSNFVIAGISGLPMSLVIENNTLKLVVNATRPAATAIWTGKESGTWDYLAANFKLKGNPTFFVNGDSVQFNDDAITKTVILNDNFTTANSAFVNTTSYILKGTGGITGSGDFVKTGKGLLDIQNTNSTYTGKTILTSALVQIASLADGGAASSLGAAPSDPANISMTDSRLIVNSVTSTSDHGITFIGNDTISIPKSNGVVAINGVLAGTGKLITNGLGQLNLGGTVANTYSGGTVISGNKVGFGSTFMNVYGLGTGPISLENGAQLRMFYTINTSAYQTSTWNLTVPANNTATLIASGRCTISGSLNGGGTLNYQNTYVRADWNSDCSSFTGIMNVTGAFRITSTSGLPLCNISLANAADMGAYSSGASSASNSKALTIGSLTGVVGSSLGGGTWSIGNNNTDEVFNGTIGSGATIKKIGSGSWTLTGANTYTSTTTINNGTLVVANTTGSATGTGAITINTGGKLAGTGIVTGLVTANSGSTVAPGINGIGILSLAGGVTLNSGSTTAIEINKNSGTFDIVNVTGAATLNGTLAITNIGTSGFAAGDKFKIINATTYSGSFSSITPASPGANLKWDLSTFSTDGTIAIVLYPTQIITFATISDKSVSDADFTASASASSGLTLSFATSNSSVATVTSAGVVHIIGAGTVTITASQAGNANYQAAADVSRSFTVYSAAQSQTITFNAISAKTYGDADFDAGAIASSSLAVTYSSDNTTVASVLNGKIHIVGAGLATINASQGGSGVYAAASAVTQTITVNKAGQSITFGTLPNKSYGAQLYSLSATSSVGLPISFSSSNQSVATISGSVVTIVGAGTTTITALQSGNTNYNAATPIQQTFTVDKADQAISFSQLTAHSFSEGSLSLSASSSSGLPISFSSSNSNVATVSGNVLTFVAAGTTTITASQSGDTNYGVAPDVAQLFTISKANQSVVFSSIDTLKYGANPFALSATASTGLPVTFISSNTDVLVLNGPQAAIVGAGTSTITASQTGNDNYNAASISQSVFVKKASLKVSVSDTSKIVNTENPTFRLTYNGFVNFDNMNSLDTKPVATCQATTNSPAGIYSVTLSGGEDNNYDFVYINGTLTVTSATSVISLANNKISVFPNPVKDVINVKFSDVTETATLSICEASGKSLMSIRVEGQIAHINVSILDAGLYILKVKVNGRWYEHKFIKN